MKFSLMVAPVVASYSPTPLLLLATNRWLLPSSVNADVPPTPPERTRR